MTRSRGARRWLGAACLAWAAACDGAAPPIPTVELGAVEPAVRAAIDDCRAALESAPQSAPAWGEYAQALDAHEFYAPAGAAYARAAQLDPREFRWPYLLGTLQYVVGAPLTEQLENLRIAATLRADYAPLHYRLGRALAADGRLEQACEEYARATELRGEFAAAWAGLGQAQLSLDRLDDALASLERARALSPEDAGVWASLAQAYALAGDTERSQDAARRARSHRPRAALDDPVRQEVVLRGRSSLHQRLRARTLAELGRHDEAIEAYRALLASEPDASEDRIALARSLVRTARDAEAMEQLRIALTGDPTLADAHEMAGDILVRAGRFDDGATALGRAFDLGNSRPELACRRASALGRGGRPREALEQFAWAAARGSLTANDYVNWGTAHAQLGEFPAARERFERAVELEPTHANAHGSLGGVLEQLGQVPVAIEHYRRAVALEPGHRAAGRLQALTGSGG